MRADQAKGLTRMPTMPTRRADMKIARARTAAYTLAIAVVAGCAGATNESPKAAAESNFTGKTVFLDPGHSGGPADSSLTRQVPNGRGGMKDCQTTGTSTSSGFPEHTFNWDVVLRIQSALETQGIRTTLSRSNDSEPGPCVDARASNANAIRPDAIVSIHADGGPPGGQGFHIIYSSPPLNDAQAIDSLNFARIMRDTLQSQGLRASNYLGDDGLMPRSDLAGPNLYNYPGILVEMGNMHNSEEAARMESPEGQDAYARAVTAGIFAYLNSSSPAS